MNDLHQACLLTLDQERGHPRHQCQVHHSSLLIEVATPRGRGFDRSNALQFLRRGSSEGGGTRSPVGLSARSKVLSGEGEPKAPEWARPSSTEESSRLLASEPPWIGSSSVVEKAPVLFDERPLPCRAGEASPSPLTSAFSRRNSVGVGESLGSCSFNGRVVR